MKWYAAATLVLIVALVFGLGALAYAMYALLAVLVLSKWLIREWIRGLTARRECSRLTASIGEKMAVIVRIQNHGRLPVPWVLVEDLLPAGALAERPPRLRISGRRLRLATLAKGSSAWLHYQVTFAARGYYQIGPTILETGDLFGLERRYRLAAEPAYVLVLPEVVPILNYDVASRRPIGEMRLAHRLFEDPTRIAGVRAYQPGDALNRVHWRATARSGTLQAKTFDPSSVAGATIVLDFHRESYAARHEPIGSELAVTCAASLAQAVALLGQQVGLVTNAVDAARRLPRIEKNRLFTNRQTAIEAAAIGQPSSGPGMRLETRRSPGQLTDILEALARAELSQSQTVAEMLARPAAVLPRDASVLVVTGRPSATTLAALRAVRRLGYAMLVIVVDFERPAILDTTQQLLAAGIDYRLVDRKEALASMGEQWTLW